MKAILAALILCAGAADASIYHYRYTGNPMPLTGDWDREESAKYGYFLPPTPSTNGPYILDLRINSAHLPDGKLADFEWGAWDGITGGPLIFVEPYSKVYDRQKPTYYDNQVQANSYFDNWYRLMKNVKFRFSGTDIVGWRLAVDGDYIDTQGAVIDSETGDSFSRFNLDYTIWENDTPGSWQLIGISEVPLPASAVLLVGALGGLGAVRRLRKR